MALERIEHGEEAKGSVWKQMTESRKKANKDKKVQIMHLFYVNSLFIKIISNIVENIRKLFIVSNNINSWRVQIERKLYKYKNERTKQGEGGLYLSYLQKQPINKLKIVKIKSNQTIERI